MSSIIFFITLVAIGLLVAVAIIWALVKFVPDEMDREHHNKG